MRPGRPALLIGHKGTKKRDQGPEIRRKNQISKIKVLCRKDH